MNEKFMEESQLNPHQFSSARVLLDLKVHNDYNNNKNINCSNPNVEGYQWKPDELSAAEELLDFKVHNCYNNNENINCSDVGLNLFNSIPALASESSNKAPPKQRHSSKAKIFSCSFCKKEFSTGKALGGHQNAHQQERALAKRQKKFVDVVPPFVPLNYHPYYIPYSNFNSHIPFQSSFTNQSSFGVQGDFYVVYKPAFYHTWPCFSSYNNRFNLEKCSSSSNSSSFKTKTLLGNNNMDMTGTRGDALENSLNFEGKNSSKGLNLKDLPINVDDILGGNNYMPIKLVEGDAEKNIEEEEELDLTLKL